MDSTTQEEGLSERRRGPLRLPHSLSPLPLECPPPMLEYFENGESEEVLFSLEEILLNIGARCWMVPALAIELSMDHKPSHREMTSQLISEL